MNAIGNLGLTGAYAEALSKLGHSLENVVSQVKLFYKFLLEYKLGKNMILVKNSSSFTIKLFQMTKLIK